MNILFLTLQYDQTKEKEYLKKSKTPLQAAANSFQNNLVNGFYEANADCYIMNTIPISTFPKYNQIVFKNNKGNLCGYKNLEIGFLNLPVLKQITRVKNYFPKIQNWIENTKGEKHIIAYSLYLPFEILFKKIKKKYPNVKLTLICPDLPCEFGILPENKIKAKLQMNYGRKTLKYAKYADAFVLLTEQMKFPLKVGDRPYTIVEGVCNSKLTSSDSSKETEKIILYTGTLDKKLGIANLLSAFEKIENSDYRLWLCGGGDMNDEIKKASEQDKRISFFGFVDKETVGELQKKATILINPRPNNEEFTKYSFPSKTMEYMASGTPVLMYKLDGIPNEYDDYLSYVKGDTVEDLKASITELCEKNEEELWLCGEKAKQFVLQNKSGRIQAQKIIDFLKTVK